MSKHRKNRKLQVPTPQTPPVPTNPVEPSPRPESPPAAPRPRPILLQLAAIIGLSAVLGFTFNAANPIGVRVGSVSNPAPSPPATMELTNFPLLSLASPAPISEETVSPPVVSPSVVSPATVSPPIVSSATVSPPLVSSPIVSSATVSPPTVSPAIVSPPPVSPPIVSSPPPVAVAAKPHETNPPAVAATPPATNAPPAGPKPEPIHWADAKSMMATSQVVLVDVRAKPAYDAGYIPNAISLPEGSPPEEFAAFVKAHPTNITLITYCSSTSCSQSFRVAKRFVNEFHYPSVKFMTGGYLEYQREELAKPQPPTNQPPSTNQP